MDPLQRSLNIPTSFLTSSSSLSSSPTVADAPNTSFAFLVHSQDTIPNNLPPSVDNKPLARQRRRRTSPEDQLILEEEFHRDSKPDKSARCRIVERVALGEKEVQIWFQNRRQNSRRKSRPLLPHEILPLLHASRGANTSSSPTFSEPQYSESSSRTSNHTPPPTAESVSRTEGSRSSPDSNASTTNNIAESVRVPSGYECQVPKPEAGTTCIVVDGSSVDSSLGAITLLPNLDVTPACPRKLSHHGRVLAVADLISPEPDIACSIPKQDADKSKEFALDDRVSIEESLATLKRTRSKVRLSMTSDGAAKLLTGEESSPSPPRLETPSNSTALLPKGLRRSFSTAGLSDTFSPSRLLEAEPALRRVPSGRSRDSRAWEFWCDTEARNELVKKADQEQQGSAANAISLIRTNSRGPLTPNLNKANIPLLRHSSYKRAKIEQLQHPKPMLGRTKSSIARLQGESVCDLVSQVDKNPDNDNKFSKASIAVISPGGDSDKENWEPEGHGLGNARRRLPDRTTANGPRSVLTEHYTIPSQRGSISSLLLRNPNNIREGGDAGEHVDPEKDQEIANFMQSGVKRTATVRAAGDDDMDCIQGLLSLSQGAWR